MPEIQRGWIEVLMSETELVEVIWGRRREEQRRGKGRGRKVIVNSHQGETSVRMASPGRRALLAPPPPLLMTDGILYRQLT